MSLATLLRSSFRAARVRQSWWARLIDGSRLLVSAEGRARAWTRLTHPRELHQTAPYTWLNRYPEIFDLAARLMPDPRRILSFGCSTGEELISLRRRFPRAEIIGAEINGRSRVIARRQVIGDPRTSILPPDKISGTFDIVFALSVLQRDPRGIAALVTPRQLAARYPFERFDAGVSSLSNCLAPRGLLCITNALYRVEDSSAAGELEAVSCSPTMDRTLLAPDGQRLQGTTGRTVFRKVLSART